MSIIVQKKSSSGVQGKIGASLFLLIFASLGIFFMGLMAYSFYQEAATQAWVETPCRIVTGEIIKPQYSDSKYNYKVEYRYVYNGRNYSAAKLSLNSQGSEYKQVLKLSQDYAPGKDTKCYVNPSNPSDAVLIRKVDFAMLPSMLIPIIFAVFSLGGIYVNWSILPFVLIPAIFAVLGLGGIYVNWKKKKLSTSDNSAVTPPRPLKSGRYAICAFFGIFLLVGIFAGYSIFLKPALKIWLSANWPQVPCVIESSRVTSGSDSTTHGIEIIFSYQYQGAAYTGDKYDFISGTSSGYDAKARIVRNYSHGQKTFCYVNPVNPDEAVLSRALRSDLWFGLIPAVFILIGGGGIIGTLRKKNKATVHVYEQPSQSGLNYADGFNEISETVLQPVSTPGKALFGTIFGAVLWNGIVSIFVYQAVKSWNTNNVEWLLSIFMIPFILIGLQIIFIAFCALLQIFNPKPVLKFYPASPSPGERVSLSWEIPDCRSIACLEIKLEGREEVKYRSGDSSNTEENIFEQISIVNTGDPREIAAGNTTLTVPRESMHSFDANNNKIIWRLKLRGRKRFLAGLNYEYVVKIMPYSAKRF